jgi:hypothetical protein
MKDFLIKYKKYAVTSLLVVFSLIMMVINVSTNNKVNSMKKTGLLQKDSIEFFRTMESGLMFLAQKDYLQADSLFNYAKIHFNIAYDYDFLNAMLSKGQDDFDLNDSFLISGEQMRKGLEIMRYKIKEQHKIIHQQNERIGSKSDSLFYLQNSFDSLLTMKLKLLKEWETNKKTVGKLLFNKDKIDITYYGEIDEGKAKGHGMGVFSGKGVYIGYWENNFRHGKGKYTWANGDIYEGDFVHGVRSGYGIYSFVSGERYEGEWKNDLREGKGQFYSKEGKKLLDGDWLGDRFKKKGTEE